MSVLVVMKVPGDTDTFEKFIAANSELVLELTDRSKAAGCVGHRFAVGDGYVLVVDEWGKPEQFEAFISSPDIQSVMAQMGATGEPEITMADPKGFPGEF